MDWPRSPPHYSTSLRQEHVKALLLQRRLWEKRSATHCHFFQDPATPGMAFLSMHLPGFTGRHTGSLPWVDTITLEENTDI